MVEEVACLRIQGGNRGYVVRAEFKIKNVEILDHASLVNWLGDSHSPRWVSQRRMICATLLRYLLTSTLTSSFWKR